MPIHLEISDLDRLVVIVVLGEVTGDDITEIAREFLKTGRQRYGKIVDTTAGSSAVDANRMSAIAAFMRASPGAEERGPLAFVVDAQRGDQARKFAELTGDERPVKVFNSLREARAWVRENTKMTP
jgi:signal recognition particle GTPase